MWSILLTLVHVVVALILIGVVLLQTGKRADLAGAFGGGGSQTVFGTRGAATLLSKITTGAAIAFMLTSLGLSLVGSKSKGAPGGSVLPDEPPAAVSVPAPTAAPVAPTGDAPPQSDPQNPATP